MDTENISEYKYKIRLQYPMRQKVKLTENRIATWAKRWGWSSVFCSFSGGKDSLVLLHIARKVIPDIPGVFVDTGLEYPEIRDFVKTVENVEWLKPQMSFKAVLDHYGYPIISKDQATAISRYRNTKSPVQRYRRLHGWPNGKKGMISKKWQHLIHAPFKISAECCTVMKKKPLDAYAKRTGRKAMAGVMATDSHNRMMQYKKQGCLPFSSKTPVAWPLAFWSDKDVWEYIQSKDLAYSKIYDMGEDRTGCMFCAFGVHMTPEPNRFQRMAKSHPKQYRFCMEELGMERVFKIIGVPYR